MKMTNVFIWMVLSITLYGQAWDNDAISVSGDLEPYRIFPKKLS